MAVLLYVCEPQEAQHGFRWAAGKHNICFYTDVEQIVGLNPIWVQIALTAMVGMFERVGLQKNLSKTKAMVCIQAFVGASRELRLTSREQQERELPFGRGR